MSGASGVALGMTLSVKVSTTICCREILVQTFIGPQRMNLTNFDDPLTFPLAPRGRHLLYQVKCLNNSRRDCDDLDYLFGRIVITLVISSVHFVILEIIHSKSNFGLHFSLPGTLMLLAFSLHSLNIFHLLAFLSKH